MKNAILYFLILICSQPLFANDGKTKLRMKGALKQKYEILTNQSQKKEKFQSMTFESDYQRASNEIANKIIGNTNSQDKQFIDGVDLNPLYKIIAAALSKKIPFLKKILVDSLVVGSHPFDLGLVTTPTFQWQKPFGFFNIHTKREIKENFLKSGSEWVVEDLFIIEIKAKSFLEKLVELELIEVLEGSLEAFADLKYHRAFTFKHRYPTKEAAQKSEVQKHYFPYLFIISSYYKRLNVSDELAMKDSLIVGASGKASFNYSYLELSAGLSANYERLSQSVLKRESLGLISVEKSASSSRKFQFDAGLKASFLSLIKLSLFDFSFNNTVLKNSTKRYDVLLPTAENLDRNSNLFTRFISQSNLTKDEAMEMGNYLRWYRKDISKGSGNDGNFLLWKNSKSKSSEIIRIKPESRNENYFYRENYSRKKTTKNWLGIFAGGFINSMLGTFLSMFPKKVDNYRFSIEYEQGNTYNLSINIYREFFQRMKTKKDLAAAKQLAYSQSTIGRNLVPLIHRTKQGHGLNFQQEIDLSPKKLISLLHATTHSTHKKIERYCSKLKKRKLKKCNKKLKRFFDKFKQHYLNTLKFNIQHLKSFLKYFLKYNINYRSIEDFWGKDQFHLSGQANVIIQDVPIQTHFKSGDYYGRTVVENYYQSLDDEK